MKDFSYTINALLILILCGILTAGFAEELFGPVPPCPLCYLQRLGMIGVATGAMMNLVFGIRMRHYAFCLASALVGGMISLRQISLHVIPGTPGYGEKVMGLSLYTWAFIVFCCSIISIVILLIDYHRTKREPSPLNTFEQLCVAYLMAVSALNVGSVWFHCGMTFCEHG